MISQSVKFSSVRGGAWEEMALNVRSAILATNAMTYRSHERNKQLESAEPGLITCWNPEWVQVVD
jgi:hypothetical protein